MLKQKMQNMKKCIEDLDCFCNNKSSNSLPDQKYGTINALRQKLLCEQFYIDILVMYLEDLISPTELEKWQSRQQIWDLEERQEAEEEAAFQQQQISASTIKLQGVAGLLSKLSVKPTSAGSNNNNNAPASSDQKANNKESSKKPALQLQVAPQQSRGPAGGGAASTAVTQRKRKRK